MGELMSEVFDYQQCIDAFMDSLAQLHGHIIEHDFIADVEEVGDGIATGIGLLALAMHPPQFITINSGEREWNEAWDYLRDNLRKWWC